MNNSKTKSILPESQIDVDILEEVVSPHSGTLKATVSKAFHSLEFSPHQHDEIHRLLDKNNEGTITTRERSRLEGYVRVGNFLNLLKAKARNSVKRIATII
jgi:hypothetical protein